MNPVSFHFQLDPNKPDEARVLALLEEWQHSGWHMQKIIITALMMLANTSADSLSINPATQSPLPEGQIQALIQDMYDHNDLTLGKAHELLEQTQDLLAQIRQQAATMGGSPTENQASSRPANPQEPISPSFVNSLRKGMRRGFSPEETD